MDPVRSHDRFIDMQYHRTMNSRYNKINNIHRSPIAICF